MTERPSPPISVTIPGRGAAPAELLAVGPPATGRAPRPVPRPSRVVAALAVAVLGAGVLVAHDLVTAPEPPFVLPPTVSVAGVTASSALVRDRSRPLVQRLELSVRLEAASGRGDSGGGPQPGDLVLTAVEVRGFGVRLPAQPPPLLLGDVDRRGSGSVETVTLPVEVAVADCAVEPFAQRRLVLQVRRGDGPVGAVQVTSPSEVVRALDRLVARTCNRPRG